jgi:FkbM family methyltransferase
MGFRSNVSGFVRNSPLVGRLALYLIPDLAWNITVPPVGKVAIRLRRQRGYWLRSPLSNDAFMLGALKRFVKPGDVVYDIGANIGVYCRFLIQRFEASQVYAFEPMSSNQAQLQRNLALGAGCAGKVRVMRYAVGDEDGTADFQVDDISSHSGSLDAVTAGRASESRRQYGLPPMVETVKVTRLDTIVSSEHLPLPDVIKLDVEGAEAMALRGARALLLSRKPRILIELHNLAVAMECLQILWDCGYFCFGYLGENREERAYKKIEPTDFAMMKSDFSLHFLAASCVEAELTEPIGDEEWPDYRI